MTSYLSENEAENLQNGDVHLAQIADLKTGYLQNHLAHFFFSFFFFIFYALSFEFNFFRPEFPFNSVCSMKSASQLRRESLQDGRFKGKVSQGLKSCPSVSFRDVIQIISQVVHLMRGIFL